MTTIAESIVEETTLAYLQAMRWQVKQWMYITSVTLVALLDALLLGLIGGEIGVGGRGDA